MKVLTWDDVRRLCEELHERLRYHLPNDKAPLYGVPRGGLIVAGLMEWQFPLFYRARSTANIPVNASGVVVDDIIDSGATRERLFNELGTDLVVFESLIVSNGEWIQFPWEHTDPNADVAENITRLLQSVGEDVKREGLIETPKRFVKMIRECVSGMKDDPKAILSKTFDSKTDEMVVLRDMEFWSLCEHHLAPFHGTVSIGYIPRDGRVVGLSKIARLIDCFSRRLQIQERLTAQIGESLIEHLNPLGVGVVIDARHLCMEMRGVRKGANTVTSFTNGLIRNGSNGEFIALAK